LIDNNFFSNLQIVRWPDGKCSAPTKVVNEVLID